MSRFVRAAVCAALLGGTGAAAAAQQEPTGAEAATGGARRVAGQVVRGTREGVAPVSGVWVTLHRVGSDFAGPLDSMRTGAGGRYRFDYRATGSAEAIYFVSAHFGGIAYFSPPLRSVDVRGDDGVITVFDTTSGPVALHIAGRHLVVGAPDPGGRRPVGEVYEISNDSSVTAIARDTVPIWEVRIPPDVTGFQVTTSGDIAPAAVTREGTRVGVFAPLSPGMRQLAFTYQLPRGRAPFSVPIIEAVELLEVLVQEPGARVTGAGLNEVAPVSAEGRTFRRFLAQGVPVGAVVSIDLPVALGESRSGVVAAVTVLTLATMGVALAVSIRRRRAWRAAAVPASGARPEQSAESDLIRALAELDSEFERENSADPERRAAYEQRRAALKGELARLLAVRSPAG